jgi:hypothetical protein
LSVGFAAVSRRSITATSEWHSTHETSKVC